MSPCTQKRNTCSDRRKRQRLTIQRIKSSVTADAQGQIDKSDDDNWETYITRRAEIETSGGSEADRENQLVGFRTSKIRLNGRDKLARLITNEMRIKLTYEGATRILNIASVVDVDYAGETIEITCTENTGG